MLMISPQAEPLLPRFLRADGGVRLTFRATPRGTAPITVAESGGYRVRFPRGGGCEGVLINTGGGMAGGDRMRVEVALGEGAEAVLTSQAAEKIYRSQGDDTTVAADLSLASGSRLDWLPQEAILFRGARLARTLDVAMEEGARLTLAEAIVFGRLAMGESLSEGSLRDRWRIRRGGRLILAEDLRLEGSPAAVLARRAVGDGARAVATVLHVAPGAEVRAEETRAHLADAGCEWGVSAWDGMLIARFLSADPACLRRDLARFLERFRGSPLPRSWQT